MSEITLVAPGGIRTALRLILPVFEAKTGHKVNPSYISGGAARSKTVEGELFDVPIVQPPLDTVIASGNVIVSSETPVATTAVIVIVPSSLPKPDMSTEEGVKRLLLAAKSVAYPDPAIGAACGVSFNASLAKLGIAEAMAPKMKPAPTGWEAVAMTARGEVDIGITFNSENEPDARVVSMGALPRSISTPTGFVAFQHTRSKEPAAASELLKFLSGPEAVKLLRDCGMEPGR